MNKILLAILLLLTSIYVFAEFEEDVTGNSETGSVYGTVDKETGETILYDKNNNESIIDTDQTIDGTVEEENSEGIKERDYSLDEQTN